MRGNCAIHTQYSTLWNLYAQSHSPWTWQSSKLLSCPESNLRKKIKGWVEEEESVMDGGATSHEGPLRRKSQFHYLGIKWTRECCLKQRWLMVRERRVHPALMDSHVLLRYCVYVGEGLGQCVLRLEYFHAVSLFPLRTGCMNSAFMWCCFLFCFSISCQFALHLYVTTAVDCWHSLLPTKNNFPLCEPFYVHDNHTEAACLL